MRSLIPSRRHRLIEATPYAVLSSIQGSQPLHLHGRTPMAEMACVTGINDSFISDDDWFCFPEQGLNVAMKKVEAIHAIEALDPCFPPLALEIATHGEPCALSFAAMPGFGNSSAFRKSIARHDSRDLTPKQYDAWRTSHLILPRLCPCCSRAAESRRRNPANNPLAIILAHLVNHRVTIRCRLRSSSFRFSMEMTAAELLLHDSHLGLTGRDRHSMIGIDPGGCHSLSIRRSRIDAEPVTTLHLANPLGVTEMIIETAGFDAAGEWVEICQQC